MRIGSSPCFPGLAVLVAATALALVAGCGGDETTAPPPNELAPPAGLTVVNGANEVILRWEPSPDAAGTDFRGYNVYRHTSTMIGATNAGLLAFRRNSTPLTTLSYTDGMAQDGTRYYYAIRAVRGSGELSRPTGECDTAPRREGAEAIELSEWGWAGQASGLFCATPQAFEMRSGRPDNRRFVDCYLGTGGDNDETSRVLALKSPHLVLNGSVAWANRVAELALLGTGQAAWDIPQAPDSGWSSRVELGGDPDGLVIAVKTPPDDSGKRYYAKLWILSHAGSAGVRTVSLRVAYQEIADYPRFVIPR
jgi:hypothetical protein